ncbi:3-mercaptopyruvate sulfurtransferase [Aureimonas sp. OT7]|nr:3-mercaptopyruvate sulfurtransferase [Aureimonas sp. OT7]
MSRYSTILSPQELAAASSAGKLRIVDASWYMPAQDRDARAEFEAAHIPGAVFFDQDAVVDPQSSLPHTLPSPSVFSKAAGALGLSSDDRIVVYDGIGLFSAARVWWMLRVFGARDVLVLDGGLPAWLAAGLPTESGPAQPQPAHFEAREPGDAVVGLEAMRRIVESGSLQIADARPAERFSGSAPEPRAGVRSGHMPGASSLPFSEVQADGRLKDEAALRAAFRDAGIDPDAPVVTTCGSGVTAAVINLALESLGNRGAKLYDGSWTEWGSHSDTPVETGPAVTR